MAELTVKPADEFATNRAEQVGPDVTGAFIVPPFFRRLTMDRERKSIRVRGGRGCGKTMFLRFFSHDSQLSKTKPAIDPAVFSKGIGLYWKADIGFCDLLKQKWLGERDADVAFRHHLMLVITEALCDFVLNVSSLLLPLSELPDRRLPGAVHGALRGPENYRQLKAWAVTKRLELSLWAQNPSEGRPTFYRIDEIFVLLADDLASSNELLADLFFRVFVDEFENLKENQRVIICDLIKHPQARYSINFAMRRDSIDAFWTSGQEQVVDLHDFRTIDLEEELARGDEFELIAAELLLMKLHRQGFSVECDAFDVDRLHDPGALGIRLQEQYKRDVKAAARAVLPSMTAPEIARAIFAETDEAMLKRLERVAEQGIRKHMASGSLRGSDFLLAAAPEASIVAPFLLNRAKPGPEQVLAALKDFSERPTAENPFAAWIDNNLHGALFFLYSGLPQRANRLYAGFDTYCTLSSPNLRFFLEFCHSALREHSDKNGASTAQSPRVSVDVQAKAAQETSELLLEKVSQLGDDGRMLQRAVRRLGRLFQVAHLRPAQSEPEINHFSVRETDSAGLTAETHRLLRQATIWSDIYEDADTKNKNQTTSVQTDHVPNAIFGPRFGISYRKRRKVTLTSTEVNTIFGGSDHQFDELLQQYSRRWGGEDVGKSGDLFE